MNCRKAAEVFLEKWMKDHGVIYPVVEIDPEWAVKFFTNTGFLMLITDVYTEGKRVGRFEGLEEAAKIADQNNCFDCHMPSKEEYHFTNTARFIRALRRSLQ